MFTESKLSKFQMKIIRLCSTVALTAVIICFGHGTGHGTGHEMAWSSLPIAGNEKPEPPVAGRFNIRINHNLDLAENNKQKDYENLSPEEKKEDRLLIYQ